MGPLSMMSTRSQNEFAEPFAHSLVLNTGAPISCADNILGVDGVLNCFLDLITIFADLDDF